MFNKEKNTTASDRFASNSATLVSAGTTLTGDLKSENDLRIDGTIKGNVTSSAKIILGASGFVEGHIMGQTADISGKVKGNIEVKDLLQLRDGSDVLGNLIASKLQIEPAALFNGQCQMNSSKAEPQKKKHEAAPAEAKLYQ